MAGACKIIRNDKNEIEFTEAPNGSRSTLFDAIANKVGDANEALPIWLASKTKKFKDSVSSPQLNSHRSNLLNKMTQVGVKEPIITIVEDGKEIDIDISKLEFSNLGVPDVSTKGKVMHQMTAYARPVGGGKAIKIGRLNYRSKGDTLEGDSILLSPLKRYNKGKITSIKGLGLGSKLNTEFLKYGLQRDLNIVFSDNLSPEAKGMLSKLTKLGLVRKGDTRYMMNTYPSSFDQNGEPSMAAVIDFVDREGVGTGLTEIEEAELRTLMVGLPVSGSDELIYKLKTGFMSKGYFEPTRAALERSGLYNSAEITDVMIDLEMQSNLRDYIYKLEDMDTPILNEIYTDDTYLTVKTGDKNVIGKFELNNPYRVEKEVIEKLGGIELRSTFEERMMDDEQTSATVATVYTEKLNTQGDLFYKLSKFKPVGEITIEESQLVPKFNGTKEHMEQTVTEPTDGKLEKSLDFLISLDDAMWREAPAEITTLVKEVTKDLVDLGVDATDLLKTAKSKSIEETKAFLTAARDAAIDLNEGTFTGLVNEYNEYFDVESDYKYKKVQLAEGIDKDNTFYIETELTGPESFVQAEVVPVGKNLYKRVRPQSSSQLIDAVMNYMYSSNGYETILPKEAFFPAGYDSDGTINMAKMQDRDNALNLRNSVEAWVDGQIKNLYTEGMPPVEIEELKKYVLYFNYYNKDVNYNKFDTHPPMSKEYSLMVEPVGNMNYLGTEFIADFNKRIIREKQKGSEAYEDFYSNFKITSQGIDLVNSDPISKAAMAPYYESNEDLVNYFKLHKERVALVEDGGIEDQIVDDLFRRNYYANYPTKLKPFQGDYSSLTPNTLAVKSKAPFIRTRKGVFEFVESHGRVGVYGKVDTNLGVFKKYDLNMTPPLLDADTNIIRGLDTNIADVTAIKNLYDDAEEKRIDKKHDNC